jgi:hypothetical protein
LFAQVLSQHEKLSAIESEAREAKASRLKGKLQQVEALQVRQLSKVASMREARNDYRLKVLLQRDDNRRQVNNFITIVYAIVLCTNVDGMQHQWCIHGVLKVCPRCINRVSVVY